MSEMRKALEEMRQALMRGTCEPSLGKGYAALATALERLGKKNRCSKCGSDNIWMSYVSGVEAGKYDCFSRVRCGFRANEEHHHLGCRRCGHTWAITIDFALKGADDE